MIRKLRLENNKFSSTQQQDNSDNNHNSNDIPQYILWLQNAVQERETESRTSGSISSKIRQAIQAVKSPDEAMVSTFLIASTVAVIVIAEILSSVSVNPAVTVSFQCKTYDQNRMCTSYSSKSGTVKVPLNRLHITEPLSAYTSVKCSVEYWHDSARHESPAQCWKTNSGITGNIIPDNHYVYSNNVDLRIKAVKSGQAEVTKIPLRFNIMTEK